MSWLLVALTAWTCLAAPLALVIGRTLSVRDRREGPPALLAAPDFVPEPWIESSADLR